MGVSDINFKNIQVVSDESFKDEQDAVPMEMSKPGGMTLLDSAQTNPDVFSGGSIRYGKDGLLLSQSSADQPFGDSVLFDSTSSKQGKSNISIESFADSDFESLVNGDLPPIVYDGPPSVESFQKAAWELGNSKGLNEFLYNDLNQKRNQYTSSQSSTTMGFDKYAIEALKANGVGEDDATALLKQFDVAVANRFTEMAKAMDLSWKNY